MSPTLSGFLAKFMSQKLATKYPYYTRQTSNYILFFFTNYVVIISNWDVYVDKTFSV